MKTVKIILTLLIISIAAISCSSNDNSDTVKYNEENPLDAFLVGSGFNQQTKYIKNVGIWEYGFSFKPTVFGKINSIIVKTPDVNTALRVTLWDVATKAVIKSEIVSVLTANITVEKSIAPIALIKDKEYLISVNSDDWILRTKTDGSAAIYPIVAGNIKITGFAVIESKAEETIFPKDALNFEYDGDVSFKFQQTE